MWRLFIDTDVLLDVALQREPHWADSLAILQLCERCTDVQGMTSTLVLSNFNYVLTKAADRIVARSTVAQLREVLDVCDVCDRELGEALVSNFVDLEDGIQHFAALHSGADVIVTRNIRDFSAAAIAVMTPSQFLAARRAQQSK